ncbi:hypothetical protein [Erythrobacter sp.]|uniref:hypothetical protein n=1 Tax=Erythrobacter sp. TaxID=1042 RepID=UPI002E9F84E5|nr:hypothetical protein [Erythrobacter sp.]
MDDEFSGTRALFLAVLEEALKGPDALDYLQTADARFVCDLAGVDPEYFLRKLRGE